MTNEELRDGRWILSIPEPLWVGWGLRIAECDCGQRFKRSRTESAYWRYAKHYRQAHQ